MPTTDRERSVLAVLDELNSVIVDARAMPMSSSCLVNREQALGLLDALRTALPAQLADAQKISAAAQARLDEADAAVESARADGRREADDIRAAGAADADRLRADAEKEAERRIGRDEVVVAAERRAGGIVADAHRRAEELKSQADTYGAQRLGEVEEHMGRLLEQSRRGREVIAERRSEAERAANESDAGEHAPNQNTSSRSSSHRYPASEGES